MSNAEDAFLLYEGHLVPRSFNAGFVALSYVVSLIGAMSTLELINRRTGTKGIFNHLLLMGSAVTMGGIAIWSMHFIGNRAVDLADKQPDLQIAYSGGFTALSFFIPIIVLVIAFTAIGTEDAVSWWRVTGGGVLAGTAICGMHYLGDASIYNYRCQYRPVNVVGAAIIAVTASIVALSMFFVFRAMWANAWWKRLASAVVLAGAVSGMHWCAATGTDYRLLRIHVGQHGLSRNATVIVVICLSVAACFIMAGVAFYTARMRQRYASKAQQVVLAAAVFDKQGRILVNPDGLLPSEKITDTFLEKSSDETFNTGHRLFHWMFQASRDWSAVSPLLDGMSNHLAQLPHHSRERDARMNIKLVSEHGEVIDKYDVIFRELFCVSAAALAERMKENLTKVGTLWDEILPTGTDSYQHRAQSRMASIDAKKGSDAGMTDVETGVGRGSLMFLVRKVESDADMENLGAAGYRFAPPHQVAGIIGSSMQIKVPNVESKLRDLAKYAESQVRLQPGVHVALFAVRARVGSIGFDVLARKGARHLLPTMRLPFEKLESWQVEFLKRMDKMTVAAIAKMVPTWKTGSSRERDFAKQVVAAVLDLRAWVGDEVFDDATLASKVIGLPCRNDEGTGAVINPLITLKLVVPIHVNVVSANCEFIPLNLFKVHQLACKSSPHQMAFVRSVHRELAPIINSAPVAKPKTPSGQRPSFMNLKVPAKLRNFERTGRGAVDWDGNPIPTVFGRKGTPISDQSDSTLKLWDRRGSECQSPPASTYDHAQNAEQKPPVASALGGIMVSQEITVDVYDMSDASPGAPPSRDGTSRPAANLNRRPSQATPSLPGGDGDHQVAGAAAACAAGLGSTPGIEMGTLNPALATRVANIEVERFAEVATFVDELFALCIDNR